MASDSYQIKIGGGVKPEVFASLNKLNVSLVGLGKDLVSNLALPLTAVFSGSALASFIAGAAQAADALGDLREETGLTIKTLGGLQLSASIKGLGEIEVPIKKFTAAVSEAQIEGTKFSELFKTMGVDPMQDLDQVLFDTADKFASWEDGVNKLGIAEELFGTRQTKFIQLLNMGAEGLQENIELFDRTHGSVSQAADVADEYNKQLAILKSSAEGAAQSLVANLGPALTTVLNVTNRLAETWRANPLLQGPVGRWLMSPSAANSAGAVSTGAPLGQAPNAGAKSDDATKKLFEELKAHRDLIDLQIDEVRLQTERGMLETVSEDRRQMILESGLAAERRLVDEKRQLYADHYETLGVEADRWYIQDRSALLQIEQEHKASLDRKAARERSHQAELTRIRAIQVQGVSDMFGNMATFAETFGKKGLAAYRVFATAQAVIDTARAAIGAYAATVGIPYVGPVLAPIAAGAAVAVGAAQIAKINGAFFEGGYTGDLPTTSIAGVVHGQEFVIPAHRVSEFGVGFFEGIRNGDVRPAEAASGTTGGATTMNANLAVINTRNQMREFMAQEGSKMAYDFANRRQRKV